MEFIIDRIEGEKAVLKTEGQELIVPKDKLPQGVKESDQLTAVFLTEELKKQDKNEQAKAILNEILKTE